MAAPSAASIIRVPGYLIWNPTTNSGSLPYGGTYLGNVREARFEPTMRTREIWAEEFGAVADSIYAGEEAKFRCVLRNPDQDAVDAIAPGPTGATGGFSFGVGSVKPGLSLWGTAGRLLFVARAPAAHPSVILYAAIPCWDEAANLQLSFNHEYGMAAVFRGGLDATGRVYASGLLSTLTVT